ncbi:gluconokinase [Thalassotalea sp. PLHSN55]|uniref:gluconokinase n=1 Tax=Thalassotalea sp. PLHSN55 TaxID=3435888 RepID=UPI003F82F5EF
MMANLFIIMGISGSGKSSVASLLAKHLNYHFVEADDFHSEIAKAHMADNKPLTDEMRAPWIADIISYLNKLYLQGTNVVLAYSGLKREHRQQFRYLDYNCHYFYLSGSREKIATQMESRNNHFFGVDLIDSQFQAMETILPEETDVHVIELDGDLQQVCSKVVRLTDELVN